MDQEGICLIRLGGITTSLNNWEGHVSAVLWFAGCKFRCPYCQNPELIPDWAGRSYSSQELIDELSSMKRAIDSIIFCGGEPTHQFISLTAEALPIANLLDLRSKLDTNGQRYSTVKICIEKGLDKLSLDVKAKPDPVVYEMVTGCHNGGSVLYNIQSILNIFRDKSIETELEVRTTIVPKLTDSPVDLTILLEWLVQTKANISEYTLQTFNNQKVYSPLLKDVQPPSKEDMKALAELAEEYMPKVNIRPRPL